MLVAAAGCMSAAPAVAQPQSTVQTTLCAADSACIRYEFHSSFWLNLHNFLFMEARIQQGLRASTLAGAGDEQLLSIRARDLSPAEARLHDRVLETFVSSKLSGGPLPDSVVLKVENRLARIVDASELESVELRPDVRQALRDFAPVYGEVWWPVHDARNREWIDVQRQELHVRGDLLLRRMAAVFRTEPLPATRVDASTYANWFGAYTTFDPPHITISSSARGSQSLFGLETLLHETGHTLLAPVDEAIARAAARQERAVPQQLSHLLLFFTAGQVVRELYPEHRPYAEEFGIWTQNSVARRYLDQLRRHWLPYLNGVTTFDEAIDALVRSAPT